jgi:hypothetical protein
VGGTAPTCLTKGGGRAPPNPNSLKRRAGEAGTVPEIEEGGSVNTTPLPRGPIEMEEDETVSAELSQLEDQLASVMKKAEEEYKKVQADWRRRMLDEIRGAVARMEKASHEGKSLEAMAFGAFARYLLNMVAGP